MTIHKNSIDRVERRNGWLVEALVILALVATAMWYGRFAFLNAATLPDFYWTAPAVMVASGQGFHNPVAAVGTPLSEFLTHRTESLNVNDVVPLSVGTPDQFQYGHRYLLLAIGYWWKVVGIRWAALADISAALHVLVVIGAYALFRIFLGRIFSLVGALWICTSALQLSFIPHLRDYSKGAFIVPAMALTAALALRTKARRPVLAVSAATGLVLGVGVGFRMDVAIMVPVAFAAIWLFRGEFPWTGLREKAGATFVLALCLLATAGPVVYRLSSGGSNALHAVLLGYADEFDANLGIVPSVYRFLPFYNDKYLEAAVNAFGGTQHGQPLRISSVEYDDVSRRLWVEILKRFPSDVFARALGATNAVLNLTFAAAPQPFLSREMPAQALFVSLGGWLHRFSGWGGLAGAVFVAVAAFVSLRQAFLAVLFLLVLAGYPSLQFGSRHYFYLQIIPVFVLLVLIRAVTAALRSMGRSAAPRQRRRLWLDSGALPRLTKRLALAVAVPVLTTVPPLLALRQYQSRQVHGLISSFLSEAGIPIQKELHQQTSGLWLARWPDGAGSIPGSKSFAYYVLEFSSVSARRSPIVIRLCYRSTKPDTEFSRVLSVASGAGVSRLGFAVVGEVGQWDFEGIELGANAARHLTAIYRMPSGGPSGLPIDLVLAPNWSDNDLFQRLARESPSESESDPRVSLVTTGSPSNSERISRFDRLLSNDVMKAPLAAWAAKNVNVTPTSIGMDHRAESEFSYLVQFKPTEVNTGDALIVEGRVDRGGIAIGLLKGKGWYSQITIGQRGRFAAVLPVHQGGTYVPMISNAMPDGESRNRFQITRFEFTSATANPLTERTPTRTAQ